MLREEPGEVERVHAIEHAEIVGLAPDDLLSAGPDGEREVPELDVRVELAQLVVELERLALAVREATHLEHAARETLQPPVLVERQVVDVRVPVEVLLLHDARRGVVDAVVDAAPEHREVRALDEGDLVLVVEPSGLEPVVVEPDVGGVPVHDVLVRVHVRGTDDVRRLQIPRELDRSELLRRSDRPRRETDERQGREDRRWSPHRAPPWSWLPVRGPTRTRYGLL